MVSGLVLAKAPVAPGYPKASALEWAVDWEMDSELEPELAPAPDWGLGLAMAPAFDSAQASVDLIPPARLQELPPDSTLQFPWLPVCVVANDDRAQRCVQV